MKTKAFTTIVLMSFLAITLFAFPTKASVASIKIGVMGPMGLIQGDGMKEGAILARDEIGSILGQPIELIFSDEFQGQADGTVETGRLAAEYLVAAGCQYMTGGFRTESVMGAREVFMDNSKIYIVNGAATNDVVDETSTTTYPNTVRANYARYKYVFRTTPVNSTTLVAGLIGLNMYGKPGYVKYVVDQLKQIYGTGTPTYYAAVVENLAWAAGVIGLFGSSATLSTYVGSAMQLVTGQEFLVSPTITDMDSILNQIKAGNGTAKAQVIITWISAEKAGRALINSWKKLDVRAIPLGINVIDQMSEAWAETAGAVEYESFLATSGTRTPITALSQAVWDAYLAKWGRAPIYTAFGTYNAMYVLAEAATRAGTTTNLDKIVVELEKTDRLTAAGQLKFTGPHPMTPAAYNATWTNGTAGALDLNPTMKGTLHDLFSLSVGTTWTDGYVRSLVVQWQKIPRGVGAHEVVFPIDRPYSIKYRVPPVMYPLWETDIALSRGIVDGTDMAVITGSWLKTAGAFGFALPADMDSNGLIDIADASRLGKDWGKTLPIPYNPYA